MTYAIFVRDIDGWQTAAQPLAYDIGCRKMACRLAQCIAASYPAHGRDAAEGTFWFIDQRGLHELSIV